MARRMTSPILARSASVMAGLGVDFQTFTQTVTRNWWEFWKETGTWQYVANSDTKSLSSLIYDTFNN